MVDVMVSEPEVMVARRAEVVIAEELAAAYRIELVNILNSLCCDIMVLSCFRHAHFICDWKYVGIIHQIIHK